MFCKVYLQCGIIIQRVVTIHGVPSVQLSRMMNLKIEFAKNKCLGILDISGDILRSGFKFTSLQAFV